MGKITELSQGSLNGLRRQLNECIENAYNKGYADGKKEPREVKAVNVEDTSEYQIGYKVGHEDGKKQAISEIPEVANKENEMYNKGLENARQVILKLLDINSIEYAKIFNDTDMYYTKIILEHYSIKEIESKIKAYEEKKQADEEIKVGDEVKDIATDNVGVVIAIGKISIIYITNNGVYSNTSLGSLEKTGRHFDEVGQLLDKLKGDK